MPNNRSVCPAPTVVHLAAECGSLARVGGLAEAVAGLARAQRLAGIRSVVVLPNYPSVRENASLMPASDWFQIGPAQPARLHRVVSESDLEIYAVEMEQFDRSGIYGTNGIGFQDNDRRFGAFVLAALEAIPRIANPPAVLHAHDWHTALAPALIRHRPGWENTAAVLSVHNAGHQGRFPLASIEALGLTTEIAESIAPDWQGRFSWLEIGLASADAVVTVSAAHAAELRSPLGGFGLDHRFAALGNRLVGITNGIDPRQWDPATDPNLAAPFSVEALAGRAKCREALARQYGFSADDPAPLIGVVARLVEQKGLDLVLAGTVDRFPSARFIILGEGDESYHRRLLALAAAHPDRVRIPLTFSESAERQLLAGVDLVLIPSLFEPCGLVQMHAQRYGAIPVARRVGGLAETVSHDQTGFLFDDYHPDALAAAIEHALAVIGDAGRRDVIVRAAMERDFSWGASLSGYQAAYRLARRHRGLGSTRLRWSTATAVAAEPRARRSPSRSQPTPGPRRIPARHDAGPPPHRFGT